MHTQLRILPEYLDEAGVTEALIPTLQEPSCEALSTTLREGAPVGGIATGADELPLEAVRVPVPRPPVTNALRKESDDEHI